MTYEEKIISLANLAGLETDLTHGLVSLHSVAKNLGLEKEINCKTFREMIDIGIINIYKLIYSDKQIDYYFRLNPLDKDIKSGLAIQNQIVVDKTIKIWQIIQLMKLNDSEGKCLVIIDEIEDILSVKGVVVYETTEDLEKEIDLIGPLINTFHHLIKEDMLKNLMTEVCRHYFHNMDEKNIGEYISLIKNKSESAHILDALDKFELECLSNIKTKIIQSSLYRLNVLNDRGRLN